MKYQLYDLDRNIQSSKDYLPSFNCEFSRYDEDGRKKPFIMCYWPWTSSIINPKGSVSPCCGIWPEKFDLGNCFKQGFKTVWNNEKYKKIRRIIKKTEKRLPVIKENENLACYICAMKGNYIGSLSHTFALKMILGQFCKRFD